MAISKKTIGETKSFMSNIFSKDSMVELPVNIENIIKEQKIDLVNYTFDDDISGVLLLNDNHPVIGINQGHSEVRKRFTIAHELGHFILHKDNGNELFMDKMLFRRASTDYSEKDLRLEAEANYFAANLLMPESAIKEYIDKEYIDNNRVVDFYEDDDIDRMAKAFLVSSSAMNYRLINLGLR